MRFISSLALVQLAAYANFAELLDTTRNNDIDQLVRLTVKLKKMLNTFQYRRFKRKIESVIESLDRQSKQNAS